jgi:hypothetical protein
LQRSHPAEDLSRRKLNNADKTLLVADEELWAQLQWQHAQLIQTAKQLPNCSSAACADSAFSHQGLKTGIAGKELECLRKENKELAKYGCIHCSSLLGNYVMSLSFQQSFDANGHPAAAHIRQISSVVTPRVAAKWWCKHGDKNAMSSPSLALLNPQTGANASFGVG